MDTLGEKLKAARLEKKLSQSDVAKKLLVSRQTISKWENNVCLPEFNSSEILNGESKATIPEKQEESFEAEKMTQEMDSLLFLIPFFFLFVVVKKRKTLFQLSTREKMLLLFNIFFTCFLSYFIYCDIPRTTTVTFSY